MGPGSSAGTAEMSCCYFSQPGRPGRRAESGVARQQNLSEPLAFNLAGAPSDVDPGRSQVKCEPIAGIGFPQTQGTKLLPVELNARPLGKQRLPHLPGVDRAELHLEGRNPRIIDEAAGPQ